MKAMPYPHIDFQGDWPELLKAEVEDLILQNGASADNMPAKNASQTSQWIAQRNPAPTGPLYAVGRPSRNGQDALGPILSTSRRDLLDKLRTLLNT